MKCEYCKREHLGLYSSGRFCSEKCARGFSTKEKRLEINIKVGNSLKNRKQKIKSTPPPLEARKRGGKQSGIISHNKMLERVRTLLTRDFDSLSYREQTKRILVEQNSTCNKCHNNNIWNGENLTFHKHHKDGYKQNNSRGNLEMLCPNCHSQTKTYCFKNFDRKSLTRKSK